MEVEKPSWGPLAAYLYILKLDASLWAWEYLRRNLTYRRHYDCARMDRPPASPRSWGLASWEDPRKDARAAEPQWLVREDPEILLGPARATHRAPSFDFWAIRGPKTLRDEGSHLSLTLRAGNEAARRVHLANDLWVGDPVAISVSGARGIVARAQAAQRLLRSLKCGLKALPERPSLTALTHMQTLWALDGDAAGASQREIARALYGMSTDLSWNADSRWRARVRYLVRCGRERSKEGYRRIAGVEKECSPSASSSARVFSGAPRASLTSETRGT
jgi:hypothetical protein